MSALRFEGVELSLGERPVLRGVDLELEAGEVLTLAGRNGAGKTSLLRVATRVLHPEVGRVTLEGRDLREFSRRELAQALAIVPQETTVPFAFSVAEVVLMGRAPHLGLLGFETTADRNVAMAAMERLGIDHLAGRSILDVSGGERQLAMVARALAQDARVLLLDEATAHLDLNRRLQVLALAREMAAEGRAVLVVTHDLGLAARFCDRVALLADGRVLAQGPPRETLDPARLLEVFGVEAEILEDFQGHPVVVPHAS